MAEAEPRGVTEHDRRITGRILKKMEAKKMTQAALAKQLEISPQDLWRKLHGRTWTRPSLEPIAEQLGCDVDELIDDNARLEPWSYEGNPKPVRLGDTIIEEVYLMVGNHTVPIEISPRYSHEFPELPSDIAAVEKKLNDRAERTAKEKGVPYYNGPAVRLLSANENGNYQAADGREVKRVVLDLGPLPWHTHMVLNGFLDDPTVFADEELQTVRERYGNPEQLYKNSPDLSWCKLSKIFTVLLTPITSDGYGLVSLRSKRGVGFAAGLFITGVSENMHRYADEGTPERMARRLNPLSGDERKKVDHLYRPTGVPNPLLAGMRGVYEEVSERVGEQLETTPDRFVFLNLIFGFPHFHPFLVGVVELPYTRKETKDLMDEYPGKDHGEGTPFFFKLDKTDEQTAKLVSEKERWYSPGLSAFITSLLYWEQRLADSRKARNK